MIKSGVSLQEMNVSQWTHNCVHVCAARASFAKFPLFVWTGPVSPTPTECRATKHTHISKHGTTTDRVLLEKNR